MRIPDVDRAAIERSLARFDDELRTHTDWTGWEENEAQKFVVLANGRHYPPKQIVSMATGLSVSQFSGGPQTNEYLAVRGFEIIRIRGGSDDTILIPQFEVGRVYERWPEINEPYGGSRQSGISVSARTPALFLFTGETGEQFGYRDAFDDAGVFSYTGEGQVGDMQMTRGNLAIVEHAKQGRALHLFESLGKGKGQKYLGEFCYASHSLRQAPDREGRDRQVIVFHLVPVDRVQYGVGQAHGEDPEEPPSTLEEARQRALAAFGGVQGKPGKEARRTIYSRSERIRAYVLMRAAGKCESCRAPSPFDRMDGTPYLEPHHTTRLSDGGLDHPRHVGALCPTCHSEIHYGRDGAQRNSELVRHLALIEPLD